MNRDVIFKDEDQSTAKIGDGVICDATRLSNPCHSAHIDFLKPLMGHHNQYQHQEDEQQQQKQIASREFAPFGISGGEDSYSVKFKANISLSNEHQSSFASSPSANISDANKNIQSANAIDATVISMLAQPPNCGAITEDSSCQTLEEILRQDAQLERWLLVWGVLTPSPKLPLFLRLLGYFWMFIIWGATILFGISALIDIVAYSYLNNYIGFFLRCCVYIPIFLQSLSNFVAAVMIRRRLKQPAKFSDLQSYQRNMRMCILFFIAEIFAIVISTIMLWASSTTTTISSIELTSAPTIANSASSFTYLPTPESGIQNQSNNFSVGVQLTNTFKIAVLVFLYAATPLLASTLMFILADITACLQIAEDLYMGAHSLTVKKYMEAKARIAKKSSDHQWTNGLVTVVAMVNAAAMVIVPLYIGGQDTSDDDDTYTIGSSKYVRNRKSYPKSIITGIEFTFIREILLLSIVFVACSRVNEKADAAVRWLCELTCVNELPIYPSHYAVNNPISFQLAGIRVTKMKLIWQAAIFAIAILSGIIKSEVASAFLSSQG